MKRFFTHCGSSIEPVYDLQISFKSGLPELVQIGERNVQEEIDSYAPSCDLNVIIKRVRNGELDLLSKRNGMYGDFTGAPSTLAEVLQTRIDAKVMYDNLPDDVRSKFIDFDQFLSESGTVDWLKKLGVDFKVAAPDVSVDDKKEGVASE